MTDASTGSLDDPLCWTKSHSLVRLEHERRPVYVVTQSSPQPTTPTKSPRLYFTATHIWQTLHPSHHHDFHTRRTLRKTVIHASLHCLPVVTHMLFPSATLKTHSRPSAHLNHAPPPPLSRTLQSREQNPWKISAALSVQRDHVNPLPAGARLAPDKAGSNREIHGFEKPGLTRDWGPYESLRAFLHHVDAPAIPLPICLRPLLHLLGKAAH